jgi:hypothetical protein
MRPLRYSINVTLDGCCDHRAIPSDEELHRHAIENVKRADALLFGQVIYEMMEEAWRPVADGREARLDVAGWNLATASRGKEACVEHAEPSRLNAGSCAAV